MTWNFSGHQYLFTEMFLYHCQCRLLTNHIGASHLTLFACWNGKKDLLLLDMLTAWRQQLNCKKQSLYLSKRTNEWFWNWTKLHSELWNSTVVLKLLIEWLEEVAMKCHQSHTCSTLKLPFVLSSLEVDSSLYSLHIYNILNFQEIERK